MIMLNELKTLKINNIYSLQKQTGITTLRLIFVVLITAVVAGAGGYYINQLMSAHKNHNMEGNKTADNKKALYYFDPMYPAQKFDKPGKSPYMDMDLVPKYADESSADAGVAVPAYISQSLGVKITKAEIGSINQKALIPALTVINDKQVAIIQSRSSGFVEKVYPIATGEIIRSGAAIAEIFYPNWSSAQMEMLALKSVGDGEGDLIKSAKQKLLFLGMSANQVEAVWQSGKPVVRQLISSPITGIVEELMVRQGMAVDMGMSLVKIKGVQPMWVEADVPIGWDKLIQKNDVIVVHIQGEEYPRSAKIKTILPELNNQTRSLKIRAELPNNDLRIRSGALAEIEISNTNNQQLIIPESALIRTGTRSLVIVMVDKKFSPQEVEIGEIAGGMVAIKKGLTEGDEVVESGQFLIDSEANLSGILTRLNSKLLPTNKTSDDINLPLNKSAQGMGVVEEIAENALVISHEPIADLQWPAMTMMIEVKNPQTIKGVKVGDNVMFSLEKNPTNAGYWISELMNHGSSK